MRFLPFCIFLLIFVDRPSWAQTETDQADTTRFTRFQHIAIGISLPLLRDQAISPLRYAGWGGGVMIYFWKEKPRIIKQMALKGGVAWLSNQANGNRMTLVHAEFDYTYLRKLKSYRNERLRLFAGGGADALMYLKFLSLNVNNYVGYDIVGSLKASGLLQYDFQLFKRKMVLTEQLSIPLIGVVSRPPFSWPAPFDAYEPGGSWTSAIRIASLDSYFRLQNRLSLDWFASNKRQLRARHYVASHWRITYEWDYLNLSRRNQSQTALPFVSLGRVVRF
jgi:hypothetical protein